MFENTRAFFWLLLMGIAPEISRIRKFCFRLATAFFLNGVASQRTQFFSAVYYAKDFESASCGNANFLML